MTEIKEINLFGIPYKIEYMEEGCFESEFTNGFVDFKNQTIKIRKSLLDDIKKNTILHEIMHVIISNTGLDEFFKNENIKEEYIVESITNALYNILKSNKGIFKDV